MRLKIREKTASLNQNLTGSYTKKKKKKQKPLLPFSVMSTTVTRWSLFSTKN